MAIEEEVDCGRGVVSVRPTASVDDDAVEKVGNVIDDDDDEVEIEEEEEKGIVDQTNDDEEEFEGGDMIPGALGVPNV